MSAVWLAVLATLCFSICANAQIRTFAVYHKPADSIDSAAVHEFQQEVHRLLADAGIDVVWRQMKEHHDSDEFDKVAVASFSGDCSVAESPSLLSHASPGEVFGETEVDRSSQVRPFFHINCPEIIRHLWPSLNRMSIPMRNMIFGRALGRVIAHEIYHIIAMTPDHADGGIAKPSFSLNDLIGEQFRFTPASLERLHPGLSSSGN